MWEESSYQNDGAGDEKEIKNANPQNYKDNGDGGNKYQKDEGTEKNDSADGNNRNGDENDGGGEEVEVKEGEKEKNPNDEGSDQNDGAGGEKNGDNDSGVVHANVGQKLVICDILQVFPMSQNRD